MSIGWLELRKIVVSLIIIILPISYFIGGKFAVIAFPIVSWGGLMLMSRKAVKIMKNGYTAEPRFTSVLAGETIQTTGLFLSIMGFGLGLIIALNGNIKISTNLENYWPILIPAIEGMLSTALATYLSSSVNNIGKLRYPKSDSDSDIFSSGSGSASGFDIDTRSFKRNLEEVTERLGRLDVALLNLTSKSDSSAELLENFNKILPQVTTIVSECKVFFKEDKGE